MQDTSPVQKCSHCHGATDGWVWHLIEVFPERTYEKLCLACRAQLDTGFTPDAAIIEARALIVSEPIIRPRVQIGGAR